MTTDLQVLEARATGRALGRRLLGLLSVGYPHAEALRAVWPTLERMTREEHIEAAKAALAITEAAISRFEYRRILRDPPRQ